MAIKSQNISRFQDHRICRKKKKTKGFIYPNYNELIKLICSWPRFSKMGIIYSSCHLCKMHKIRVLWISKVDFTLKVIIDSIIFEHQWQDIVSNLPFISISRKERCLTLFIVVYYMCKSLILKETLIFFQCFRL